MPTANSLPAPIAATSLPESNHATKPHRAQVTYSDGLIDVRANDSSLNQILRSISRATGLQITGGVEDQRVFGNYGPASTSEIIATLLDGTGTNMLLTDGDATTPPTLVLTPRSAGGATPPNISTLGPDDDAEEAVPAQAAPLQSAAAPSTLQAVPQPVPANGNPLPSISVPQQVPSPQNNVLGSDRNVTPTASQMPTTNSVPLDALPKPSTTTQGTGGQGIVDTPNPPAPGSTTGTSPTTPQSIYQQLLQMQQRQQQQQQTGQPPLPH